jgi:hypothetical protein
MDPEPLRGRLPDRGLDGGIAGHGQFHDRLVDIIRRRPGERLAERRPMATGPLAADEDRQDGRSGPQREDRDAPRCAGDPPEERDEDTLMARRVLIEENGDHPSRLQRPEHAAEGALLVDRLDPRLPPHRVRERVEARGIQRTLDDTQGMRRQTEREG